MHTLTRLQHIEQPIERVFSFFQAPENLALITPPWLGFRVLTPSPIPMKVGVLIDYTIRWSGVPVRWTTLITTFDQPHRFIDEQIKGPYSLWHHTHIFTERDGGTDVLDEVRYIVPLGMFGRVMQKYIIRRQLDQIFDYRAEAIREYFSSLAENGHSANERELTLMKESAR